MKVANGDERARLRGRAWRWPAVVLLAAAATPAFGGEPVTDAVNTSHVVLGYNDLGMHCMNSDFSEMMILPPFNTLHAQVLRRGAEPDIISGDDVTVRYIIPGNAHSADKFNFWAYPYATFGGAPLPDVGLFGARLSGAMEPTGANDWYSLGIPIVPTDDTGRDNPYPLALITVTQGSTVVARTQAVVPVSTEMSCMLCHNDAGKSTASDLLEDHDRLHGTDLMGTRPVLCADCHADNALGLPGLPGILNLSAAMHGAHAPRVEDLTLDEVCYACHPGVRTKCQRDVHFSNGIGCSDCHGDMYAMSDTARIPWVNEPRCEDCHARPGFEFEQPGTLYRNSVGHSNVHCAACHGSPHAITPTVTDVDNVQAETLQGYAGRIDNCTVCHMTTPAEPFFHRVTED